MDQDYKNFVERMGSFDINLEENQNELKHWGVLGMKWGRRRTPEQIARAKGHVDSATSMVKEAKNINNAVKGLRSTTRKDLSSMSDQELKAEVQRMNMEQQYSMLSSNKMSKGQAYVGRILEVAGSTLAITSSALGIALAIKQLKS